MTSLLDKFCPAWLSAAVVASDDPLAGSELQFTAYQSDWDSGLIVAIATHDGSRWTATIGIPDLETALDAACRRPRQRRYYRRRKRACAGR